MRAAVLTSILVGVAVLAGAPHAQAQSAYDYPWCAIYPRQIGGQACYYATYAQCMATMSGIGGYCVESPYYRGTPRVERRHRNRAY
jgi:hypothetical protein